MVDENGLVIKFKVNFDKFEPWRSFKCTPCSFSFSASKIRNLSVHLDSLDH